MQQVAQVRTPEIPNMGDILEPTLDTLALLGVEELENVYRRGTATKDFTAFEGAPTGRMLSAVGPLGQGLAHFALRQFSGSSIFPWAGKSFYTVGESSGMGINRVRLGTTVKLFAFSTRIGPSAIDGDPCVILDYDRPENPFFIRAIHDEIRCVAPGLWLGPAMVKTKSRPHLVLFFALHKRGIQ